MKRDLFVKLGMTVIAVLLMLNLLASARAWTAARPRVDVPRPIQYKLVRVDPSTNQEMLFQSAGEQGLELVGSIEVAGNTGYVVFKK